MFVSNLNARQQGVLLTLAESMMKANGRISSEEQWMYDQLASECDQGVTAQPVTDAELSSEFTDHKQKVSLLLELLGMALADDEYHENESHIIQNTAVVLGIDGELVEDMETWVRKQLIMAREAQLFMEE